MYLLTHSLLAAWLWSIKDTQSERDPMEEFMLTLRRQPTPTTEAMQNGIDFEDLVTAIVNKEYRATWHGTWEIDPNGSGEEFGYTSDHKWYLAAKKVATEVQGGQLQYKAKKKLTVAGTDVLLYGRLDALKAGTIYDIKFSKRYERGKYIDSTQHPVYLELIPEASSFTYLVSNGIDVWTETYRRDETKSILPTIERFFDWLDSMGLTEEYRKAWAAK